MAERRKNDPVLNHTQDHLVRKLFSKFKKGPEGGSVVGPGPPAQSISNKDPERGEAVSPSQLLKAKTPDTNGSIDPHSAAQVAVPTVAPAEPVKPAAPKLGGWGRLRGDSAASADKKPAGPAAVPAAPPPAAPAVTITVAEKKEAEPKSPAKKSAAGGAGAPQEYQAINDRLNRIEQLISEFMIKVDEKTRSIEKSVAKSKSSKKHGKPHSVTICVDSAAADIANCDEQFL